MSEWMKWNIRFTSFMPLWVSMIIKELFGMWTQYHEYQDMLSEYEEMSFSWQDFLGICSVQLAIIVILILCIIVSMVALEVSLAGYQRVDGELKVAKIVCARRANRMFAELLIVYVLPLLAFDLNQVEGIVLFLIYFWVISILCIQNDYFFINLILDRKGYHTYICDLNCDRNGQEKTCYSVLVLSKVNLGISSVCEIRYKGNNSGIYMDISKR